MKWGDPKKPNNSLSSSGCFYPWGCNRCSRRLDLSYIGKALLTQYSVMTRVVPASAESDTLRDLLRSVCKCWHAGRKQTIAGCLPCQGSNDLVSGLIAWLWASLPLQREAGSVSSRLEQLNSTEDGWGQKKKKSADNYMVLKSGTPVKLHTLWEASPSAK